MLTEMKTLDLTDLETELFDGKLVVTIDQLLNFVASDDYYISFADALDFVESFALAFGVTVDKAAVRDKWMERY